MLIQEALGYEKKNRGNLGEVLFLARTEYIHTYTHTYIKCYSVILKTVRKLDFISDIVFL